MPRPKDAKVWNEDLILALQAREQMARQNGKRAHIMWKEGRQLIESVRGDIYPFKNGRIVHLPAKLKTMVENEIRCIIAGTKPILPDGYVPPDLRPQHGENNNPYMNDPYLKNIKQRGGAFAILMAFHTTAYDGQVLTKPDICRLAQPYCDTEMEANYMAGRARGAWSSIHTLEQHDLIMVQKRRVQYDGTAGGFRSQGSNSYMLTANGKLFIQALFQRNPDLQQQMGSGALPMSTRRGISSNRHNEMDGFGFPLDAPNGEVVESWPGDLEPFTLSSSSSQLPVKTSPSRPFSALLNNNGHVLDASPSAKRQLQFIPACEAARNAALERQAIQESLHEVAKRGVSTRASTPTKTSNAARANKITPASSILSSSSSSVSLQPHRRLKPPPVMALYDDDNDDDFENDHRKIPANPYRRTTTALTAQPPPHHKSAALSQRTVILNIDSDSDDDILLTSPLRPSKVKQTVDAVDLTKTPAVDIFDENDSDEDYIQIESQSSEVQIVEMDRAAHRRPPMESSPTTTLQQLTIFIDDRERNRNSTPRTLRMELTRLVSSESNNSLLSIVWPKHIPRPIVEESRIAHGDFSFHRTMDLAVSSKSSDPTGSIRIPILLERKRIGDIVQRSTKKDHWYQLQRMQDEAIGRINDHPNNSNSNGICIMLLEGDPRTTRQYEPYGAQNVDTTSPFVHTIDDEETLYRYMCRAILNDQDQTTRFIQTSDEQGSLRMVGVLGLMAITNERLSRVNQKIPNINTKAERVCIIKRLQAYGIPWNLVTRITDEIRSVPQMDALYSSTDDVSCRELLLVPLISDLCDTDELKSTASAWSRAIYRAWHSELSDPATTLDRFKELSPIVDDDALLLEKLHDGMCADLALDAVLATGQVKGEKESRRIVCIDLPKDLTDCFPSSSANAATVFRLNYVDRPQKIPSIVMRTYAGPFYSSRFIIFTVNGDDIVRRIKVTLKDSSHGQNPDYLAISKTLAEKLYRDFCVVTAKDDTIVLLIRALGPALDSAAKKNGYRSEIRILAELIQAELMIEHKAIVIHAIRLNGGDREMIIRQMALACYHYQVLKYKSKQAVA